MKRRGLSLRQRGVRSAGRAALAGVLAAASLIVPAAAASLESAGPAVEGAKAQQPPALSVKSEQRTPLEALRALIEDYRARAIADELTTVFEVRAEAVPAARTMLRLTGAVSDSALLSPLLAQCMQAEFSLMNDVRVLPEKAPLKNLLWAIVKAPSVLLVRPTYGSILHAPATDEAFERFGAEALGTPLRVLAKNEADDMRLVQAPDGRIGWVDADQLFLGSDTSLLAWNRRPRVLVVSDEAVFRVEAPHEDKTRQSGSTPRLIAPKPVYSKEMRLPEGSILALDASLDVQPGDDDDQNESVPADWRSGEALNLGVQQAVERKADMRLRGLRLPDGRAAQLVSGELAQLNAFEVEQEVLRRTAPEKALTLAARRAQSLVGQTIDASTLLRRAFSAIDLIMPATLSRAAYLGAPLSGGKGFGELRTGDLLFFGSRDEEGRATIESAGIYLEKKRYVGIDSDGRAALLSLRSTAVKFKTNARSSVAAAEAAKEQKDAASAFLWAVRLTLGDLKNPCLLSRRSHPFHQAPPDTLSPCRLRNQ